MKQIAKTVLLGALRGYKWAISPMFPPACRYLPTCSEYATEAVERYGAVRGSLMAVWRLLRCHPFSKGGYDPVVDGAKVDCKQWEIRVPAGTTHGT
jgi:hypothetical protein